MALKKSKRDIDKERMFTKIMPSLNEENEAEVDSPEDENTEKSAAEQTKENKVSETKNTKEEKSEPKSEAKPLNTPETVSVGDKKAEEVKNEEALKSESNDKPQQEKKEKGEAKKTEKSAQKKESNSKQIEVYNITEEMINGEIDAIFHKFNCCHCDICKCTIIADVLNNLPTKYVAAKPSELKKILNKENNGNIKSAIIQSVFKVIANPPHKPV